MTAYELRISDWMSDVCSFDLCDFYVFSSHKLYGPEGLGVLFGRTEALHQLRHWQFGGEMVQQADYHGATFRPAPLGFEAGTPPIASVIGLGATLDYLSGLDPQAVSDHEQIGRASCRGRGCQYVWL